MVERTIVRRSVGRDLRDGASERAAVGEQHHLHPWVRELVANLGDRRVGGERLRLAEHQVGRDEQRSGICLEPVHALTLPRRMRGTGLVLVYMLPYVS